MNNVVIGIPTFKRPESLTILLDTIAEQDFDCILYVVVADNEGENGQGSIVVNELINNNFPFPIKVIPVVERGISQVRNALLNEAFANLEADYLAMVDDDERVEPYWISELVKMQQQWGVDVVGGYVLPEFESTPPDWVYSQSVFKRPKLKAGKIDMVMGTTNVLLNRSIYKDFVDNKFDCAFGLTGGGDKEFFTRLKKQNATFAFAPEALSYEMFGESRATKQWAKQRAYRIGSGDARIFRRYSPSIREWVREFIKLIGAFAISSLMFVLCLFSPSKRMFYLLKLMRQKGKLNGLFGEPVEVYKNVHGN
jgi:glycosyltransferase involved in cell wall biosynthesis